MASPVIKAVSITRALADQTPTLTAGSVIEYEDYRVVDDVVRGSDGEFVGRAGVLVSSVVMSAGDIVDVDGKKMRVIRRQLSQLDRHQYSLALV